MADIGIVEIEMLFEVHDFELQSWR
jgi:hypothetical protein